MKLTIEDAGVKASIESDVINVTDVIEELVIPALMGVGFVRESIYDGMADALDNDPGCQCDHDDEYDQICDGCGFPENVCQCD